MKQLLVYLFTYLFSFSLFAQYQANFSSSEIQHRLKKLNNLATVLYIAAHPDDENTRLISYLTKEKGYRTVYLSLTRGDGGQNLIGNEQGVDLGIIRTQELLAARAIDGAEQYFSRAYDFGYSKTPEETFKFWNKQEVLQDVVVLIRILKPDVIICRFPTTGEGGHGHHTASAILAEEAYELAGDANAFSEISKQYNLAVWQPKRLLWNTFNFGSNNTTSENQFKIDVGGYNPLLGKSYGEIASESRSQHRSQGFGSERRRGEQWEYFKTLKGTEPQNDLLDGVEISWKRIKGSEKVQGLIDKLNASFNPLKPEASVPALCDLYKEVETLFIAQPENRTQLSYKLIEIKELIIACSGLFIDALAPLPYKAVGDSLQIKLNVINRSGIEIQLDRLEMNHYSINHSLNKKLENNKLYVETLKFVVDAKNDNINISIPYFTQYLNADKIIPKEKFEWIKNLDPLMPEIRRETQVSFWLTINGLQLKIDKQIQYKQVDPSIGELYQPLVIAPSATVSFVQDAYLFRPLEKKKIKLRVKGFKENVVAEIKLLLPDKSWICEPAMQTVQLKISGEEKEIEFLITAPSKVNTMDNAGIEVKVNDQVYYYSFKKINYDHIPEQLLFYEARTTFSVIDLKPVSGKIGYISGAGDKVPDVLAQLGYDVTLLTENDLLSSNLQQFKAIICGVRTFNTEKYLKYLNEKLFDYAYNGGRLIIQYNTSNNLVTNKLGPYPFSISRERVTEEDAKVTMMYPEHFLLNSPNKITEKDFDNWVQERGLYFVKDFNENYQSLLSMSDSGENIGSGNLIYTQYGKGIYIYTGLSFFRQLPAGVPGAIRLFINLIEGKSAK
ncbi:MAG: PIG-L family deacetylase [Bacteroidia bacterium]